MFNRIVSGGIETVGVEEIYKVRVVPWSKVPRSLVVSILLGPAVIFVVRYYVMKGRRQEAGNDMPVNDTRRHHGWDTRSAPSVMRGSGF
jgi:hypothetical protein